MDISVNFLKAGKWIEYMVDLMIIDLVELNELQLKGRQRRYIKEAM